MAWAVGEDQHGGDSGGMQGALVLAAVPAAALTLAGRDLTQARFLSWTYRPGWFFFHHQDVARFLHGDQELGVVALGLRRVDG
jgi:hypothetical protein